MNAGPVQFVGAGPGAADLLTVRAVRLLEAADAVLYPGSYLDADVLESCSATAELIDTQSLDLDEIVAHIVEAHSAGRRVVRLVSGDPSLYSAVSEQTRRLDAAGVPWQITPGVPSYAAAAARVGRELTVPLVAQSVVLTRTQARSTAMPDTESLAAFAATRATLVLHLAITAIRVADGRARTDTRPGLPGRGGVPGFSARGACSSRDRRRHRRSGRGGRVTPSRSDSGGRSAR